MTNCLYHRSHRTRNAHLENTLTQAEISEIEQLGVKFIDPPQSPQHTNSTLSRSSSQNIHRVASSRRTSINRRKSLKTTPTSHNIKPQPISSDQLLQLISNQAQPPLLVIDLRCLNTYLGPNGRLKGSINLNFPSLLIKRFRKGVPNHFQLNPFITTEAGKRYYSKLENTLQSSSSSSVLAQLDICVIDDQLVDELPKQTSNSLGSVFLDLLAKLFAQHQRSSGLYFLNEKFENLSHNPAAQHSLLLGPLPSRTKPPKLRRIDTSESLLSAPRSTASLALSSKHSLGQLKIDHLSIACSPTSHHSPSPLSKLSSSHPPEESPSAEPTTCRPHVKFSDDHHDPTHDQPQPPNRPGHSSYDHSPGSPSTNPEIHFKVSTIIPSFLYLGPEPSKETDFAELDRLGIQRILNTALECVDEEELIRTRYPFIRKYFQIPLRDFVEETGVQKGIDQANRVLNDAFLHSAPTYVRCKAGKSRSVTIVLAYLIHRYRWSLKKVYAHVSERRAGICPNIGFLAELMSFEQRELMPKTHSVLGPHRANSIRPGESGLLGHLKSARLPLPTSLLRARSPPTKLYSLNLDCSHCFRVRSLAVAAKTDFFAPPPPPSQPPPRQPCQSR
ncbi:hypothetical protein PtA15_15A354 [Puccinia triticina]|uniref:protein-tyrosine-phosphatase n=1 Tax=Puccinia triticina TaxID=208348 RepID=A0ABY7D6K3_9BASI|nr:uncharacterized protein PtA15_15A354 [Puccinia triticina]WAQ91961.1 hypothetical protein PtA15_15A354 [Puccinia triticina]